MREPISADRIATQLGVPLDRIESYRAAGLLDPDGDGMLDQLDVLRYALLTRFEERGLTPEEIVAELRENGRAGITRLFLGNRRFTLNEAAERMGLPLDQAEQLCLAMGYPTDALLDEPDLQGFERVKVLLDVGIPWEGVLEGARVFSDGLRRIAQVEIEMTHRFLCERLESEGKKGRDVIAEFYAAGPTLTELAEDLIKHMHEDFLLEALSDHAVGHLEAEATGDLPGTRRATIVFVDLALFTPLAEAHGDQVAAEILERFDSIVRRALVLHHGRLVKQIGDGFMLTFDDESDAVRFSLDVMDAAGLESDFPAVRVGMNSGPVLYRAGDYVGNSVNVAARVGAMAMPNVILMTEPVAQAARAEGIEVEEVGVRRVKGAEEPVAIYRTKAARVTDHDPVCGMVVGDRPIARLMHEGREFGFCSQDCVKRFLDNPDHYAIAAGHRSA